MIVWCPHLPADIFSKEKKINGKSPTRVSDRRRVVYKENVKVPHATVEYKNWFCDYTKRQTVEIVFDFLFLKIIFLFILSV